MKEKKLIRVYRGLTPSDAQYLADRLTESGIEAFVDNTDAPADGLAIGRGGTVVRVHDIDLPQARQIVQQFERDGHEGLHGGPDEQAQDVGLDQSSYQRHAGDVPDPDDETSGVEKMDTDRHGPEAPEVEGLVSDEPGLQGRIDRDEHIRRFGVDRDVAQPPDIERPEIQDQKIDRLDGGEL